MSSERIALSALVRLKFANFRLGEPTALDLGLDAGELSAREAVLGRSLPPSYLAVARHARSIGGPEQLFDAVTMGAKALALRSEPGGSRFVPIASSQIHKRSGPEPVLVCFDLRNDNHKETGELPTCIWHKGYHAPLARSFGEWLDVLADQREERLVQLEQPPRLHRLLTELGFHFPSGMAAELETAEVEALFDLVGGESIEELPFDHTGKARVRVRLDDGSAQVRLGAERVQIPAEQVFSWLRGFRDEDPLAPGDSTDTSVVPDLRRAPRRLSPDHNGERRLVSLAARHHVFLDAAGAHDEGLVLLGRVKGQARSLFLRFEGDQIAMARYFDAAFSHVHLAADGALWALSEGFVYRFYGYEHDRFALHAPDTGAPDRARAPAITDPQRWRGIGGIGTRVLVWGKDALLGFDGRAFEPFSPDLKLSPGEIVQAVDYDGDRMTALVTNGDVGAVTEFDGEAWRGVDEAHLLGGTPHTLRSYRGVDWILDGKSTLHTQSAGSAPRQYRLPAREAACHDEGGKLRLLYDVLPTASGLLLGCQGGFLQIQVGGGAVFHRGAEDSLRGRLVAVPEVDNWWSEESYDGVANDPGAVLALLGSSAWSFVDGHLHPIDLTEY